MVWLHIDYSSDNIYSIWQVKATKMPNAQTAPMPPDYDSEVYILYYFSSARPLIVEIIPHGIDSMIQELNNNNNNNNNHHNES